MQGDQDSGIELIWNRMKRSGETYNVYDVAACYTPGFNAVHPDKQFVCEEYIRDFFKEKPSEMI